MPDWGQHVRREQERYLDGEDRLPAAEDQDARQRQLTRMGNAASGAGLSELMNGNTSSAGEWFAKAADRYRESFELAPPDSWGRPIAIVKARLLADDWSSAEADAHWTLDQGAAEAGSPIGRYAATLALLVLARDEEARVLADMLRTRDDFPRRSAMRWRSSPQGIRLATAKRSRRSSNRSRRARTTSRIFLSRTR